MTSPRAFQITADSSSVVYLAAEKDSELRQLFKMPIHGGPRARLSDPFVDGGALDAILVSPDDSYVVYRARPQGQRELFVAPIDASDPFALSGAPEEGGNIFRYSISPDGTRVVYLVGYGIGGTDQLFSVRIDGTDLVALSNLDPGSRGVWAFTLNPDGTQVLFEADPRAPDKRELFRIPIEGGEAVRLSDQPAHPDATVSRHWIGPDDLVVYRANAVDIDKSELFLTDFEPDRDEDGLLDFCDICPGTPDPEQLDGDRDGAGVACDCADDDATVQSLSSQVEDLRLFHVGGAAGATTLSWEPPTNPGGTVAYDTLRSSSATGFDTEGVCVESQDMADRVTKDSALPEPGKVFYFLVRAIHACGPGALGYSTEGVRSAAACP